MWLYEPHWLFLSLLVLDPRLFKNKIYEIIYLLFGGFHTNVNSKAKGTEGCARPNIGYPK